MYKLPLNIRRITGWFFLLLFATYFAGVNFFPHTHVVDNQRVVHSHPYAPAGEHHHSTSGFELIKQLSGFISTALSIAVFIFLSQQLIARLGLMSPDSRLIKLSKSYVFLRPPPVV